MGIRPRLPANSFPERPLHNNATRTGRRVALNSHNAFYASVHTADAPRTLANLLFLFK